jgi:hypothetical protein
MKSIRSMSPLSDLCALACAAAVFAAALLDAPVQARPIGAPSPSIDATAPPVDTLQSAAHRTAP